MVQIIEQKKRQKVLIIILIVAAIVAVLTWYFYSQKGPSLEGLGEVTTPGASINDQKLKTIKLDFSVLDDVLFKSLKSHGVLPVAAGETGQTNPFQP